MKHLKRIDEFFGSDDPELAAKYEIPNLQGKMDFERIPLTKGEKEDSSSFYRKMLVKYPVLARFNQEDSDIFDVDMHAPYATSINPVGGINYYGQIGFFYHRGMYCIDTVIRNLEDYEDFEKWDHESFDFSHIEDVYPAVEKFLKKCEELNIIRSGDRTNYMEN